MPNPDVCMSNLERPASVLVAAAAAPAPPVILSVVLGLGGSSTVNNVLRTVIGLTSMPFMLQITCSDSGSGLRWSIERWLWSRAADRVFLNSERKCTVVEAHISNLALCEQAGMPCDGAPGNARLLLLSGCTVFFCAGAETWVRRYAFGQDRSSNWWRSGSFYQLSQLRPALNSRQDVKTLEEWQPPEPAPTADPSASRTHSFLSKLPSRFKGLPLNLTGGLGLLRASLFVDAAYDGRVACDCAGSRSAPGWWLGAPGSNQTSALEQRRGDAADASVRRAHDYSRSKNCTDAASTCGVSMTTFTDCLEARRRNRPCNKPGVAEASNAAFTIACIGDSHTAGAGASKHELAYPGQLQAALGLTVGSVVNYGVAGARAHRPAESRVHPDQLKMRAPVRASKEHDRLSYWESPQLKALLAQPKGWDVVVSMFGTNDVSSAGSNRGCRHQKGNATARAHQLAHTCPFVRDYRALVERTKAAGRSGKPPTILLVVPPPAVYDACGIDQALVTSLLPDLVRATALVTKLPPPIDAWSALGGLTHERRPLACSRLVREPAEHCEWFTCDRVHLNDRGYGKLGKLVASAVARQFPSLAR